MPRPKKKPRLASISTIHRRLYRLAADVCRMQGNNQCAYCFAKSGEIKENGKPVILDGHHLIPRDASHRLKFEPRNFILLCKSHHKFSREFSAHKNPLLFFEWYNKIYSENVKWLIDHKDNEINLKDRETLQKIENNLREKLGSSPPA
jgi:hypothetical protein